jgi:hypothetical protein
LDAEVAELAASAGATLVKLMTTDRCGPVAKDNARIYQAGRDQRIAEGGSSPPGGEKK